MVENVAAPPSGGGVPDMGWGRGRLEDLGLEDTICCDWRLLLN